MQLKTGGPVMAVRFPVDQLLLCAWVDANGVTRRSTFSPSQLKIVHHVLPVWARAAAALSTRWNRIAICC